MKYRVYLDCFTEGLEDLTRREQRDLATVLRFLDQAKRFSVFEATANQVIAATMDTLFQEGYVESAGGAFPWTKVTITARGRALLETDR